MRNFTAKRRRGACIAAISLISSSIPIIGCATDKPKSCSLELHNSFAGLGLLHMNERLASEEAGREREKLIGVLNRCGLDKTPFSSSFEEVVDITTYSLLEYAVAADSEEWTSAYLPYDDEKYWTAEEREASISGGDLLRFAAMFESPSALRVLLEHRRRLNEAGEFCHTTLHYATAQSTGGLRVIKELIDAGIDVNQVDDGLGLSAMDLAVLQGDVRKAACMQRLGVDLPKKNAANEKYWSDMEGLLKRLSEFYSQGVNEMNADVVVICTP